MQENHEIHGTHKCILRKDTFMGLMDLMGLMDPMGLMDLMGLMDFFGQSKSIDYGFQIQDIHNPSGSFDYNKNHYLLHFVCLVPF